MALQQRTLVTALGGSFIALVLQLVYRRYLRARWVPVGCLKAIHLYPLKSGGPTVVPTAHCHKLGLQHHYFNDREFVAFDDATGLVITSRTDPYLLRIRVEPTASSGVLRFTSTTGSEPLELDISNISGDSRNIEMKFPKTKMEIMHTVDCGEEAASWLSREVCRPGLRLGYWPTGYQRDICKTREKELAVFEGINNSIAGAYSNMSSFLLMNIASVNDLLSRLNPECAVRNENFRANILIDGCQPYEEDKWKMLRIGEAVFKIVKPCARCELINVNTVTFEKDPEMEPLKNLKTYRQLKDPEERKIEGDSPVMGCYMGLEITGKITVGDTVYASYYRPKLNIFGLITCYF